MYYTDKFDRPYTTKEEAREADREYDHIYGRPSQLDSDIYNGVKHECSSCGGTGYR